MKNVLFFLSLLGVCPLVARPHLETKQDRRDKREIVLLNTFNLSLKERYLSQKATKAYIYNVINGSQAKIDTELKLAMTMFESNLNILKGSTLGKDGDALLTSIDLAWTTLHNLLTTAPDAKNAPQVITASSKVLESANNLVLWTMTTMGNSALIKVDKGVSKEALLKHINLAGRNRMLSQRVCMYYATYSAKLIDENEAWKLFLTDYKEIESNINYLFSSMMNNISVDEMIAFAIDDWNSLKKIDLKEFQTRQVSTQLMYDKTLEFLYSSDDILTTYKDFFDIN